MENRNACNFIHAQAWVLRYVTTYHIRDVEFIWNKVNYFLIAVLKTVLGTAQGQI